MIKSTYTDFFYCYLLIKINKNYNESPLNNNKLTAITICNQQLHNKISAMTIINKTKT